MKQFIFSFCLFIGCIFGNGFYQTTMADSEVFVISLQKSPPPVKKLITQNGGIKNKSYRDNEHNIMLIKNPNFIALIDTGFPHTTDTLRAKLKEQGVDFNDVTHILLTHGHRDHLGGILSDNGHNNFPNAKLLLDKKEYDFWLNSEDSHAKKTLQSFGDNKEFLDNTQPLFDSQIVIKAIPAYGHTPGHTLFSLEDSKEKIVFIADLLHIYDVQIPNPQIAIEYDVDKQEAVGTRLKMLKELRNTKIVGVHTPFSKPIKLK